ncbi:hypothetical protein ACDA63_14510 [Uliginosibacterium sp. sgz301328]|uniref:hypothetical protein n=1 Tax=Uliginosibacterium sp. sgz301328 TaxID=3243764 RepID=UPI00359E564A
MEPPRDFILTADAFDHLAPLSAWRGVLAIVITAILLGAVTWIGRTLRVEDAGSPLRVDDATQSVSYIADAATGDIRVIKLRNGIGELARLHDDRRGTVTGLGLSADGRVLTVSAAAEQYEYDTRTHQLIRAQHADADN